MTAKEHDEFLLWLQTHTAVGRVALEELRTAFDRAASVGYTVSKTAAAPANV